MKPITRREQYLSAIAGESESVPTPVTREEILLQKIYESGGTGGEGLNPNLFAKKEDVAATYATKDEVSEDYVSKDGLANQQLNPLTTVVGTHNGNYYPQMITTVDKADNVVSVSHSGNNYCGAKFDIPINPYIDNTISFSISDVVTEIVGDVTLSLYTMNNNSNAVLTGARYYVANGETKTFSYTLTPAKIVEWGFTDICTFYLSTNKAISYDERVTNTYGDNTTIASIGSDVATLKNGQKLLGKKAMFLGDSITQLTGERSWVDKFCALTGATKLVNVAVISATLCDKEGTVLDGNPVFRGTDNNVNNTLANQVQKIINNQYEAPDLIVVAIGTNDGDTLTADATRLSAVYNVYNRVALNELDRTHSEGAFRYCNETLHNLYPNALICWCNPIQRQDGIKNNSAEAMRTLTMYGGVPNIETNRCGIMMANETSGVNGEDLIDGLHPNANGATKMAKYNAAAISNLFI